MTELPKRKTDDLCIGRVSIPHARYFITLCTQNRQPTLTAKPIAEGIIQTWRKQHHEGDFILKCATVMPDHFHLLCELGERLSLSQVISKFKSKCSAEIEWQRNYYDHRLRADDSMEPFGKYIFLNPYRKQLITLNETWPWWTLNRNYRPEFTLHLKDDTYPQTEWVSQSQNLDKLIEADLKP